ncbi:MAG: adenylate/guanylate cyclase domain-containing protein [Lachnospiraceae bacterium]|nr:adenylate/guanylate cyclase domain-containing protein [Lachnospiraceae bacterium]
MAFLRKRWQEVSCVAFILLLGFILQKTEVLYTFDRLLLDGLCQWPSETDYNIKIIAIDEKALETYGPYSSWSREIMAELLEWLYAEEETAPAVTALDIIYTGETSPEADERLAQAASLGVVVTGANLIYGVESYDDYTYSEVVTGVEYPYEALLQVSQYGFSNTVQDQDGYIRRTMIRESVGGEQIESFAYLTARLYAEEKGLSFSEPATYDRGSLYFTYTGKSGDYEVLSLSDVLSGSIPHQAFAGCLVLVGAYAPGMMDYYQAASSRGQLMYGVEVNANIIQALLEGKTAVPLASAAGMLLVLGVLLVINLLLWRKKNTLVRAALIGLAGICAYLAGVAWAWRMGLVLPALVPPLLIILSFLLRLSLGYVVEKLRRRQIFDTFSRYMAPQFVRDILKDGEERLSTGGVDRQIAVFFSDIRGFTSLSEELEAWQVTELLNRYLSLVTEVVFRNEGTVDKFIGDAVMVLFNAPVEQEDYLYRAATTAKEIIAEVQKLNGQMEEEFGCSLGCGIGLHCGHAVVGSFGGPSRMDYTAVGDTVNVASRLEGLAPANTIYMSEDAYLALEGRLEASPVGELELKGKKQKLMVYEIRG